MPDSVYDVILLIGSSKESWEKAAANAVEQASKSLRDVRIAEIVELDMQLDAKGKVEAYRAKVRLSFKIEVQHKGSPKSNSGAPSDCSGLFLSEKDEGSRPAGSGLARSTTQK